MVLSIWTSTIKRLPFKKSYLRDRGFTLVETLFSIGLFTMLAIFMASAIIILNNWHADDVNKIERMEWNLFIRQMNEELQLPATVFYAEKNTLRIKYANEIVSYEKYGNIIRRTVDELGHEVFLQGVESVLYEQAGNSLKISVKKLNGDHYEKMLFKQACNEVGCQ